MKINTVVVLCASLYGVYALECFICKEDCSNPKKEKCPDDRQAGCASIKVPEGHDGWLVTSKNCLKEGEGEEICKYAKEEEKVENCYHCKEDGCNEKDEKD